MGVGKPQWPQEPGRYRPPPPCPRPGLLSVSTGSLWNPNLGEVSPLAHREPAPRAGPRAPRLWALRLPRRAAQLAERERRAREPQPQPEPELRGRRQSREARRGGGGSCDGGRGGGGPECHLPGRCAPGPSRSGAGRARARAGAGRAAALSQRPPPPLRPRRAARRPRGRGRAGGSTLLRPSPASPPSSSLHPGYLSARWQTAASGTRSQGSCAGSGLEDARSSRVPGRVRAPASLGNRSPPIPQPTRGCAPTRRKGAQAGDEQARGRRRGDHRTGAPAREDSSKSCRRSRYPPDSVRRAQQT